MCFPHETILEVAVAVFLASPIAKDQVGESAPAKREGVGRGVLDHHAFTGVLANRTVVHFQRVTGDLFFLASSIGSLLKPCLKPSLKSS